MSLNETRPGSRHACLVCWALILPFGLSALAQPAQTPDSLPPSHRSSIQRPRSAVAPDPQHSGLPAITLAGGLLTVQANGSELPAILREVARLSGMSIQGSVSAPRVYGTYGPSNPRDVLKELLSGTGYNFMMYGVGRDGVPRQLTLTRQDGGPTPAVPASPTSTGATLGSSPEPRDPRSPDDQPVLGPGAIANVPPSPPEDDVERAKQNMDRLRKIQQIQNGETPH